MQILEIIEKKKQNKQLTEAEIKFFIEGYVRNTILDYQASALLMAIWFNQMTKKETYFFTKAMVESGSIINFDHIDGIKVDKHSTGGVGDKVSLIIGPILAALDINVAKMSGQGLGHTGGTVDKLASIGVKTEIGEEEAMSILRETKMFIMSQTKNIVPADRLLYSLRNATATVDCLPLVASSICSKKIALKTDYVFIDIKYGEGAFCETYKQAKKLARLIKFIFKSFQRKSMIHITNMNQPLGRSIGNGIEVKAALDYLSGKPECVELEELINEFVADILIFTKLATKETAREMIKKVISSGEAKKAFYNWVVHQGASQSLIDNNLYFKPNHQHVIKATKRGLVTYKSTKELGNVVNMLGAGRFDKNDIIDFHAGIYLTKIHGEDVEKEEEVAILYSSSEISPEAIQRFENNLKITRLPLKKYKMIEKVFVNK